MTKLARLPVVDRAADAAKVRVPRLRTRYYAFLSYSHRDKELADWLHGQRPDLSIIFITGRTASLAGRRRDIREAMLPKPFEGSALSELVRKMIP